MFNLRNNKLGMTLIEMVISLVVLGILTTSTMGIIISSNNIFISTSNAALDRQVGGHVFETLSSILRYSTHMSIYDADKAPAGSKSQSVAIQVTDDATSSGKLMYKGKDASDAMSLYQDSFYGNRTVSYSLKQEGTSGKHIKLTVTVYRDGKKRYELSRIIKCVNLALISVGEDANFIKDTSTTDVNQFIAFSVDEQLISGGKNAYSLEYKIAEYMAKYNRIQREYSSKLLNVYGEVNEKIGKTENKEGMRASEATYNAVVAMRNKAVISSGTPVWEDTSSSPYNYNNLRQHYQDEIKDLLKFTPTAAISVEPATNPYYGVVATKEELYAGFLLTYYDTNKDGKVDKSEFPQFSDPDTFFSGTSIANYVSNTNSNQMVILSYFKENTSENYDTLYSKKDKTVFTYSGTKEAGYSHSVWYSTNDGPGYDSGEILHDTNFTALNETRPTAGSMNADCHGKDPNVVQTYFSVYTGMYAAGRYFYHEKVSAANNVGGMPAYEYKGWGATASYNNTRGEDVVSSLLNNYKPTQLANGSNCSVYTSSADNGTIYLYPTVDLPQGWYYYKDGSKYYFFYLSASQSETSKETNANNIAVKGNAFSTVGGSGSKAYGRIVLGNTDGNTSFTGWAYAQAQYAQMEQGASDAKKATIDTVGCHQYTDYILYGVDWNSWFLRSPSNGLLNKIMTGAVTIIDTVIGAFTGERSFNKQDVQAISGSNAVLSLGNHGQMTVDSTSTTVASYNMAWVIYSPKRGTWYYLPQASTRLSNATSKISWTSRKDQPMPLDVDINDGKTWASSAAMVSDIDRRKLSSSGLFGLVDTTKDVLWVGLPTGNQVEVKFD